MSAHPEASGKERLGDLGPAVDEAIDDLSERHAVLRIWDSDHTLWQDDPDEVADRLGWLEVAHDAYSAVPSFEEIAAECFESGLRRAVLMGMGGSSLFPEVLARTFGSTPDRLRLEVLDTTDPAAVVRVAEVAPLEETLFVAASKSGSTVETRSHLAYFWDLVGRPEQFAVITDPRSELAQLSGDRGFRETFVNRPDIGGRYSALSWFGLVPGALAGVDLRALLDSALAMADSLRPGGDPRDHPGLRLGATMAAAARAGRDKLTLLIEPEIDSFGLWIEQLVAESTGKRGTGVVPVVAEPLGDVSVYGRDRVFVSIGGHPALDVLAGAGHPVVELPYEGPYGVGALVLLWEFATAMCGVLLGINPFDQPNVAEAKDATARVLAAGLPIEGHLPLGALVEQVQPGDYLAIQAFVDPGSQLVGHLERSRVALRDRLGVATTFGLGPRYLHSTGQLHKGGPPSGVFVQVVGDDPRDVPIPDQPYGFSMLKQAQAMGDLQTLRAHGLRAGRVALAELVAVGQGGPT